MFLSRFSISRPVAMCCLIIALTLLGLNSYRKMPLELMPKIDVPYITVMTVYPGASPQDVEVDVAKKIEDAVSSVDGLKHVTSICMENVVQTLLEFNLGVDVNVVATDVREKIDLILGDFPSGVEKPVVLKFDVNAKPVATFTLTGDVPLEDLYDYADNTLSDKISTIAGVANVELMGGSQREIHVLLDREKIVAAGLSSLHVVNALQQNVLTIPLGRVKSKEGEYSVRFDADYKAIDEIGALQVAGGATGRRFIRDLGDVEIGSEELRQKAYIDGKPCIGIRVVKKADANAVEVVNAVKAAMGKITENLPGGMELVWVTDKGKFIQATVDNTSNNIIVGIILTAVILFLFLFSFRTTFIIAITMPLTVVISFFFMNLCDFALNISTLLALGLSIGVLVTNSIVVMESIMSRLKETGDPWKAALSGSEDVAVAVMASAGTNMVVLFPIGMMGSLVGLFFRPFAWTMLTVNIVSLFISFTLTPILCAVLLKGVEDTSALAKAERHVSERIDSMVKRYVAILRFLAHHKVMNAGVLILTVVLFVFSMSLGSKLGFSFVEESDQGDAFIKLEFPTRLSLDETTRRVSEVENLIKTMPEIQHMFTTVGKVDSMLGQASEGVYLAQILMKFSDKTNRSQTMDELLDMIRERIKDYPDCISTVTIANIMGSQNIPLEMEIAGTDFNELEKITPKILKIAQSVPGVVEPDTSLRDGKPEIKIKPRRVVFADTGVAPANFGMSLRGNLEGIKAAAYKSGDRTYDIRVKYREIPGKDQIEGFQIPAGKDTIVPVGTFAEIEETLASVQITRGDKRRMMKLYANINGAIGSIVDRLSAEIDNSGVMPAGYEYVFRGDYDRMKESGEAFLEAGILAILLTYLVLAAILESFSWPFFIMVTVPLALIGVMWALFLAGSSISVFVILGFVMLIGIVVNNAVLILSHMHANQDHGAGPHEAMFMAIQEEFRPIIMITLAAVLGMLPLAVSNGIGSEMSRGIGIASVGGIIVSAVLTLLVIPLLYIEFTKRKQKKTQANLEQN